MRGGIDPLALRTIIAGLLNSQLSPEQIRRIAVALDNPEAVKQLQDSIFQITNILRQSSDVENVKNMKEQHALIDFIQRRRLSKAQVRDRMKLVVPNLMFKSDDHRTMRELVDDFVAIGPNTAKLFMSSFGGEGDHDPWLKGIIGRDKE